MIVTPATAAGVTDKLREIGDIVKGLEYRGAAASSERHFQR